jgi:hypothetical protein
MTISRRTAVIAMLAATLGLLAHLAFVRTDATILAAAGSSEVPPETPQPARPAPPAIETPLGTVGGSEPETKATLLSLRRTGPKVVTARLQITLDDQAHGTWLPALEGEDGSWYTAEGLRLVDEFNGTELFPLVDDDGSCLCSRDIERLRPGESIVVSAKFPAPLPNVTHASLHVPGFSSFDSVPIAALS